MSEEQKRKDKLYKMSPDQKSQDRLEILRGIDKESIKSFKDDLNTFETIDKIIESKKGNPLNKYKMDIFWKTHSGKSYSADYRKIMNLLEEAGTIVGNPQFFDTFDGHNEDAFKIGR